jgi:death-on-curing protein
MGTNALLSPQPMFFLRIHGWQLKRPPMQIYTEMMQRFESGNVDIAHLEPWLRTFAAVVD